MPQYHLSTSLLLTLQSPIDEHFGQLEKSDFIAFAFDY
jgi:hypothetical protein